MDVVYNGAHSICFWKKTLLGKEYTIDSPKFTWDDFHLIPASRPDISIPKPNYTLVTIPNTSKRLNITDYLVGGLTFDNRNGEWLFYIDHYLWPDWITVHHELEEYFNGSKMLVSLDDKTKNIYEGRVWLASYEAGDGYSSVTIGYDLDADPIKKYEGIYYRVRFISSSGEILQNDRLKYNDIPYYRNVGSHRWSPPIDNVKTNIDYISVS